MQNQKTCFAKSILPVFLFCLSSLLACGRPLQKTAAMLEREMAALTLATDQDIAEDKVIESSYIVAFRPEIERPSLSFSSYLSESLFFQRAITDALVGETGIDDLNYMTSFDWRGIKPLTQDPAFMGPRAMQLGWRPDAMTPVVASVAEVKFRSNAEARETLARWLREGKIWYAEPNSLSLPEQSSPPSDGWTNFASKYKEMEDKSYDNGGTPWHKLIHTSEAMAELSKAGVATGEGPLVAVLDSGVDVEHPSLKNNMWKNDALNQAGCRDDVNGCNATQSKKGTLGNGDVWPAGTDGYNKSCDSGISVCKHGTHVAGLVAAEPSNGYGGVCPICRIIAVKVVGKTARGEGKEDSIADSSIIAGFSYVTRFTQDGKAAIRLINASFGKFQRSRTVGVLVSLLFHGGNGILLVAAAGNEDTDRRSYPAAFDEAVAVANVQSQNSIRHVSSNYGRWVDIAAPGSGSCAVGSRGDGLLSTVPGSEGQDCLPGTSMASPVVAGVAALVLAKEPDISARALRDRLITTANPSLYTVEENAPYIPQVGNAPLPLLGSGIVDAKAAVTNTPSEGRPPNETLKRVTPGCSQITGQGSPTAGMTSAWLWCMMMLGPCVWALRDKWRMRKGKVKKTATAVSKA